MQKLRHKHVSKKNRRSSKEDLHAYTLRTAINTRKQEQKTWNQSTARNVKLMASTNWEKVSIRKSLTTSFIAAGPRNQEQQNLKSSLRRAINSPTHQVIKKRDKVWHKNENKQTMESRNQNHTLSCNHQRLQGGEKQVHYSMKKSETIIFFYRWLALTCAEHEVNLIL